MADQPDANPHPQSARTLAILDDLDGGMPPAEVARNHGATKQWVHFVRKRAGIPLPAPLPKAPTPPAPKPVKHPRPIPARTLAVLEDVRAGMLYEAVAARHGLTEFYVGRLAKQHGVARSQTDPDWRKRKYGAGVRKPTNADTTAIVRDLQAGDTYAEVAARYGRPLRSIYNTAYRYGIRRRSDTEKQQR